MAPASIPPSFAAIARAHGQFDERVGRLLAAAPESGVCSALPGPGTRVPGPGSAARSVYKPRRP